MKNDKTAEILYKLDRYFYTSNELPSLEIADLWFELKESYPEWDKQMKPFILKAKKKRDLQALAPMEPKQKEWKGWDWTEISEFLGVDIELSDEEIIKQTNIKLDEIMDMWDVSLDYNSKLQPNYKVAQEIREFLVKLNCGDKTSFSSVLKGIYKIEDSQVFLQHIKHYLQYLWD